MAATLPIFASRLQIGYSEEEDRLTILAVDSSRQGIHVALTRRLTDRLINGLAHLLEQTSAVAVHAPADMRDDIILMEHQGAIFGKEGVKGAQNIPGKDETGGTLSNLPVPRLLSFIDVNVTPTTFEIRFREGEIPLVALSLNRVQVHRVVETLTQRAEAAGWNIIVDAAWLEPGQTEIVLN